MIEQASRTIPVLLAPNTSLGITLVLKLVRDITKMLGKSADIDIVEKHHRSKKDAPSGTALKIGEVIAKQLSLNLNDVISYQRTEARKGFDIGFNSLRSGFHTFDHEVLFSMGQETLSVKHSAADRLVFGKGALVAAKFLVRQIPGLYNMEDVLAAGDADLVAEEMYF